MARPSKGFTTGVAAFSPSRGRLALPVAVLQAVGWNTSAATETLIAEIIGPGHLRLHRQAALTALIDEQEEDIRRMSGDTQEQETRLQVLADRFREITFSKQDNNRVALPQDIVLALTNTDGQPQAIKLFVQAGEASIDIMTNAVRLERLKRYT